MSIPSPYNFFWTGYLISAGGKEEGGAGGPRKEPSSLGPYWKVYHLVYQRATGGKLNA